MAEDTDQNGRSVSRDQLEVRALQIQNELDRHRDRLDSSRELLQELRSAVTQLRTAMDQAGEQRHDMANRIMLIERQIDALKANMDILQKHEERLRLLEGEAEDRKDFSNMIRNAFVGMVVSGILGPIGLIVLQHYIK